jgi:phosphoglycerate dehydrogenase-like enzyme
MTKVVVAEIAVSPQRNLDIERDVLGAGVQLEHYTHDGSDSDLINACRNADVILTDYAPFSRAVIEELRQCELISVAATGHNSIDVGAARDANISVCAVDEYCTDEVADHTMLLILSLCRRLPEYQHQVQEQHVWQFDSLTGLGRLRNMTLGLIGYGRIGQAVAQRARGFGMTIVANDPFADSVADGGQGIELCDLPSLYAMSDIISLHCGLNEDNREFLNETSFQAMRKQPILINCARGGLVDESALERALDSGQISGAGLDVLNDESPDIASSPFLGRNNVILTPHIAFYSDASIVENRIVSAANIRNFLDGKHANVRKYIHQASS